MKKFIVKVNSSGVKKEDIKAMLTRDADFYMEGSYVTVEEFSDLPPLPEVRKIETGILSLPNGFSLCGKNDEHYFTNEKIDLNEFPELKKMCRDIRTEWDFSSIPVGSLIEIILVDDTCSKIGFNTGTSHPNEIRIACGYGYTYYKNNEIKSIRIIELVKDGE